MKVTKNILWVPLIILFSLNCFTKTVMRVTPQQYENNALKEEYKSLTKIHELLVGYDYWKNIEDSHFCMPDVDPNLRMLKVIIEKFSKYQGSSLSFLGRRQLRGPYSTEMISFFAKAINVIRTNVDICDPEFLHNLQPSEENFKAYGEVLTGRDFIIGEALNKVFRRFSGLLHTQFSMPQEEKKSLSLKLLQNIILNTKEGRILARDILIQSYYWSIPATKIYKQLENKKSVAAEETKNVKINLSF